MLNLFSILRALVRLSRTVKSLEETLIARTLIEFPQLEGFSVETFYKRESISSPLLKWLYDRRALRGWERDYSDVVVEPEHIRKAHSAASESNLWP
jgi:hypothetical protein